jgi:tRNA threonylcarbamoyladenosine biosynthesis protein TsaE
MNLSANWPMQIERRADSPEAMEVLGAQLAAHLTAGLVIFFHGELGAGKTTLIRGILHGLGHRGAVKSPTYTLVEPYALAGMPVYHFDLYRLNDPEELEFIGVRDYLQGHGLCLIEWAERGSGVLPAPDVDVVIERMAEGRRLRFTARTGRGGSVLRGLP